ncbi:hypothetical protein [Caulobacter soli]|uniref:hypothetical protein n=1 Tax=Caulobacter soli TaxID=2708539 RepID=UPI0013EB7FA9|nr:hypothetical protein [Caulobacter soli]
MRHVIIAAALCGALHVPAAQAAAAKPMPAAVVPAADQVLALQAELADLRDRYQRQQVVADNARQETDALRAELKLKDELLVLGRQRNAELYTISSEILDRLARRKSLEPFVQAHRVSMENKVQDYEDRLRAARVYDTTLPPSVQLRMQQELSAKAAAAPDPAQAAAPTSPAQR